MGTSSDDPKLAPSVPRDRIFAGEGSVHPQVRDYVVLIPSDVDMPQREVMRAALTDVLRRNGRVLDTALVDEILDAQNQGGYDFNRESGGVQESSRKVLPGNVSGPYEGYSVFADTVFQEGVLTWADAKYPQLPLNDTSPDAMTRMLEALKSLKLLAEAANNGPAKEALDALTQSIEARDGSALNGVGGAAAAFKTVIEFTKMAIDPDTTNLGVVAAAQKLGGPGKIAADGSELLGRVGGFVSIPLDVAKVGTNFYKLVQGKNDDGQPMSSADYGKLVVDIGMDGASLTTGTAQLLASFGKGGAAAETIGALGAPIAAVALWGKLNYEVVKLGGEAIQSTMEYEVAQRFAEGRDGKAAVVEIGREQERVARLPTGPNNAARSAASIINGIENQDTRQRFIDFLKRRVEPDDYITKVASRQSVEEIPKDQMQRMAKEIKSAYPRFIQAEFDDVKNFVLQKQEGLVIFKTPQQRGEYLKESVRVGESTVDVRKPAEVPKQTPWPASDLLPKRPTTTDILLKGVDAGKETAPEPKLQSGIVRSKGAVEREERLNGQVAAQLPERDPTEVRKVTVELQKNAIRDDVNIEKVVANNEKTVVFGLENNASLPSGVKRTSADVERAISQDLVANTGQLAQLEQAQQLRSQEPTPVPTGRAVT